tara:strand:- start:8553 stop:8966 length:414 start_codon:yes stop_codon:yes gene_type:complete
MIIKTSSNKDVLKAKEYFDKLINQDCKFELRKIIESRSSLQNSSLHLFFVFIADELNNLGLTFNYDGLNIKGLESRYTTLIVKEFIWRPIQIAMFGIQSTKKINTQQINEIIDVITKYFGDRGINLEFPSIESLMNK